MNIIPKSEIPDRCPTRGFLYLIVSPTFPNIVKIGKSIELQKRLSQYNAYNPNNDFAFTYISDVFDDYTEAESQVLESLARMNIKPCYNKEWFDIQYYDDILSIIKHGRTSSLYYPLGRGEQ
jgi:hypothetical protein